MADIFEHYQSTLTGPATYARSLTPSDTVELTDTPRWLSVENGGILRVDMLNNTASDNPVDVPVMSGQLVYIRATKIYATGTSASGILGYW